MNTSTIAAIATPLTAGGIGIVRVSGPCAIAVCDRVFSGKRRLEQLAGYTAAFGHGMRDGAVIDECVALVFRAPHSYTGEDVVELSCHGGVYVVQEMLRAVLAAGAVAAGAGEFTKRAFLHGKMDLTKAEAVADIISADGKAALRAAMAMKDGALFQSCDHIVEKLTHLLGSLSAWADFPDEDVPFVEDEEVFSVLAQCRSSLESLLETYPAATAIKGGVKAAVAGRPNAGKSSIMNRLCGRERSIVTHIAGTTRDVVEESVEVEGITLRLFDTAGIRKTEDVIEAMGVERSRNAVETADMVLFVADGGTPLEEEDRQILQLAGDKPCLCVINKSDLQTVVRPEDFDGRQVVQVSAATGEGMDRLTGALADMMKKYSMDPSQPLIANARQLECVKEAKMQVNRAYEDLQIGQTYDIVTVSIESALEALFTLTGRQVSEEVISDVFSRFCVGK